MLSSIEIDSPKEIAERIEQWGNSAITFLCDIALGYEIVSREKVRTNAVFLLGWMKHPQTLETVARLVRDANSDISIRAIRAAGRQNNVNAVEPIGHLLNKREREPILFSEALNCLSNMDSDEAKQLILQYQREEPNL